MILCTKHVIYKKTIFFSQCMADLETIIAYCFFAIQSHEIQTHEIFQKDICRFSQKRLYCLFHEEFSRLPIRTQQIFVTHWIKLITGYPHTTWSQNGPFLTPPLPVVKRPYKKH